MARQDDELHRRWAEACDLDPTAQSHVLLDLLCTDAEYAPSTAERLGTIISGLAAVAQALGHQRLDRLDAATARQFITARTRRGGHPSNAVMHLRRTAIRAAIALMNEIAPPVTDPTAGLQLPPKVRSGHRPLEPGELTMLRVAANSRSRRRGDARATVALAEAGATTGETARLRWIDVAPDCIEIDLPGAGRTMPRLVRATAWGTAALRDLQRESRPSPDELVVYRGGSDPTSDTAQAAITSRLRRLLVVAGLDDADLRPGSVRLCLPAAQLHGDGRVADAARRLGVTSLDVTAELCGWDWSG